MSPIKPIPDDDTRALLRALGIICEWYFQRYDEVGGAYLWHSFESHGKEAFHLLEKYGLIEPRPSGGWDWTPLGVQIVDVE